MYANARAVFMFCFAHIFHVAAARIYCVLLLGKCVLLVLAAMCVCILMWVSSVCVSLAPTVAPRRWWGARWAHARGPSECI